MTGNKFIDVHEEKSAYAWDLHDAATGGCRRH